MGLVVPFLMNSSSKVDRDENDFKNYLSHHRETCPVVQLEPNYSQQVLTSLTGNCVYGDTRKRYQYTVNEFAYDSQI